MNPIEEHINYYQHFAPNPTAFRESLEKAIGYAKSSNKHLNMDLRDYFAAKALQGLLVTRNDAAYLERMPEICYKWADAMMKAREL
jgi:hypothetical protein